MGDAYAIDVLLRPRRVPPGGECATIVEVLRRLGHDARWVEAAELEPARERVVLLRGNAIWHPEALAKILACPPERRPLVVLWHSEPLPLPRGSGYRTGGLSLRELAKIALRDDRATDPYSNLRTLTGLLRRQAADVLAISTATGQATLAERGFASILAPLGYEPRLGRDLGLERRIDVLFLGIGGIRRRDRALRRLRREGVDVVTAGSWSDPRFWGEERTRLLNETKILLNLPRRPGLLSGGRMLLGMANKALVVAEPAFRPQPYEPGRHYVEAPLDDMAATIAALLADPEERARISEHAYAFVTRELTLKRSLQAILAGVEAARRGGA